MSNEHALPQFLLKSWPFPRGAGRLLDRFFGNLHFQDHIATVKTSDGFSIKVFPNDLIGRHIYLTGEFDRSTVEVLVDLARPGDTLLDIGANIGYVSACFLQNVAQSHAIAVDPQPGTLSLLRSNLEQFGPQRSTVLPIGISDKDGSAWMETFEDHYALGRIVPERKITHPKATCVEIQLWSARRLFEEIKERAINIVKIDVEGYEETVLNACRNDLARLRPRAILFEDHTAESYPQGAIGSIFRNIGYKVVGIKKRLTRLQYVPILAPQDCTCADYLATPQ